MIFIFLDDLSFSFALAAFCFLNINPILSKRMRDVDKAAYYSLLISGGAFTISVIFFFNLHFVSPLIDLIWHTVALCISVKAFNDIYATLTEMRRGPMIGFPSDRNIIDFVEKPTVNFPIENGRIMTMDRELPGCIKYAGGMSLILCFVSIMIQGIWIFGLLQTLLTNR